MEKEQFTELIKVLKSIKSDIPSDADVPSLYDVEKKLDKLAELAEKQNDLLENLIDAVNNIDVSGNSASISMEDTNSLLSNIDGKLKDSVYYLSSIEGNTAS